MKKVSIWGLTLLLIGALTATGFAQAPAAAQPQLGAEEYTGFMAAFNATDLSVKATNAEKFLTTFKTAHPTYIAQAYMMMIKSWYSAGNFAKALETADKQATLAPALPAEDKKVVLAIGLDSAPRVKNTAKTEEYSRKILAVDPKDLNALITLSGILGDASTLPTDEAAKNKRFDETLDITKRALAVPKPTNIQPAQWTPIQLQLRHTTALVLLNQKKYAESIAESNEALKLDKKDGYAYYLLGLATKPEAVAAIAQYNASIDKLNENRTADQLTRDELKAASEAFAVAASAKTNELIEIFAKSVASGWSGAANARTELKIFTGTPAELDQLIEKMKAVINAN